MKVTHRVLFFASFYEENSRARFAGASVLPLAPKNARHLGMYAQEIGSAREFSKKGRVVKEWKKSKG